MDCNVCGALTTSTLTTQIPDDLNYLTVTITKHVIDVPELENEEDVVPEIRVTEEDVVPLKVHDLDPDDTVVNGNFFTILTN